MATKNGTNALEAARLWVGAVCDLNLERTPKQAIDRITQASDSLDWWEFTEICQCNLALLELGQSCDNPVITEVFNQYKDNKLTYNEVLTLINTNDIAVIALLARDDIKQLLTLSAEFLVELFDLADEDQEIALAWLDYHDYKNFGNDPNDILELYQGIYSVIEYVQEYLEESGIEIPGLISIDYNQTFNDLTHDCTIVKLGSKYMIYND